MFTVTTNAEIATNDIEDGPAPDPRESLLSRRVDPQSEKLSEAPLRFPD
ncbi:MAG: hypothetical protein ACFBQW_03970 [Sphingomonadaceae bacterium]